MRLSRGRPSPDCGRQAPSLLSPLDSPGSLRKTPLHKDKQFTHSKYTDPSHGAQILPETLDPVLKVTSNYKF